jgi:hypothetical protein
LTPKSILGRALTGLQFLSGLAGYVLLVFGWIYFVVVLILFLTDAPNRPTLGYGFRTAGCLIVPGWLLHRFGVDLFPFSRRFFPSEV